MRQRAWNRFPLIMSKVGSGYGYGDGDGWKAVLAGMAPKLAHGTPAFWRSSSAGQPCNGGSGSSAYIGKVDRVASPMRPCTNRALHGTLNPSKWKGERLWIVVMRGEIVVVDDDKIAATEREIVAEVDLPNRRIVTTQRSN